jgi:tight adherence protein C
MLLFLGLLFLAAAALMALQVGVRPRAVRRASLRRVKDYAVHRSNSALAREMQVMLSELRMGETRTEALRRLAERVPSADMRNFVQTLLQSESVGMSRATILATQAADLRHRRQMAAEELAQKAPIKMLFPLLIFILPVMFVMIVGPAIQQMSRLFGP